MGHAASILGDEAAGLLEHRCETLPRKGIHVPGPDFVDRVLAATDRRATVLASARRLFASGRLAGTGYLSLLPVDHGIAHTAGMVFAPNPAYFDPDAILELALEGGCSGLVTSYGVIGALARKAAHRIPLILKINHDEQFAHPARYANTMFANVRQASRMGCAGVAATVYFGGPGARKELAAASRIFAEAHALGMITILFCYLHPKLLGAGGLIFAADLTAEANHIGVTIEADFIKQKQPLLGGGFARCPERYAATHASYPVALAGDHPVDMTRYQVALGFEGRAGLLHSGGPSELDDRRAAVRAAVINKRGGGMGMLAGRKAFQVPLGRGIELLHAVQDVYLDSSVTLA